MVVIVVLGVSLIRPLCISVYSFSKLIAFRIKPGIAWHLFHGAAILVNVDFFANARRCSNDKLMYEATYIIA